MHCMLLLKDLRHELAACGLIRNPLDDKIFRIFRKIRKSRFSGVPIFRIFGKSENPKIRQNGIGCRICPWGISLKKHGDVVAFKCLLSLIIEPLVVNGVVLMSSECCITMLFKGNSTWANSTSDAFLPDFWIFRFSGNQQNRNTRKSGFSGFPAFRNSDFRKSGFPEIRKSRLSDFRTSESPKIRVFGNPKILIFPFPGHRM